MGWCSQSFYDEIATKEKRNNDVKLDDWPEYDEYEHYDNETSFLSTLCSGGNEETGFARIAKDLNVKFGNNRTSAQCRRKAEKEGFV